MSDLPPGWTEVKLADVASTQLGRMLSARRETGVYPRPYLRNRDVQWGHINVSDLPTMDFRPEEEDRFRLASGDVLVCEGGEVGRAAVWKDQLAECYFQKAIHRVRTSEALSPEFLRYLLEHYARTKAFARFTSGSTIAHLPQEDLRNLPFNLPPRGEQERIVAAIEEQFSRLDAGVAALERMRQNLKRLRIAILEKALCADWPQRLLHDLCLSITDGDHQPPPQVASGVPFLVIGNVRTGHIDFSGCRHVPFSYYEALDRKRRPQQGDVLYTVVGSYGIPVLVKNEDIFCVQRHIAILRPSPEIDAGYLAQALRSISTRRQVDACATGTAQKTVPLTGLRRVHIPVPPFDEQRRIAEELESSDALIDRLSGELELHSHRSTRLQSAILAAAFSGELVPQDSTDEPASILLKRISSEQASLSGHRTTRGRKPRILQEEGTV